MQIGEMIIGKGNYYVHNRFIERIRSVQYKRVRSTVVKLRREDRHNATTRSGEWHKQKPREGSRRRTRGLLGLLVDTWLGIQVSNW